MKKTINLLLILTLCVFVFNCKTQQRKTSPISYDQKLKKIKSSLDLTKEEYNFITKDDSIVSELYTTIDDSVRVFLINKRLDSFFDKKYSKIELLYFFKIDREFKDHPSLIIERNPNIDSSNALHFNNIKDAKQQMSKFDKELKESIKKETP